MMAHEPSADELTDDGAVYDSDQYPVDSIYYPCCNAVGGHSRDCCPTMPIEGETDDGSAVRMLVGLRRGEVTIQVNDDQPITLEPDEAERLGDHLMALATEAVIR